MKLLATILILTCATLHAQSVIVYKTDAGYVRGMTAASVSTVTTNLTVGGEIDPGIKGTYTESGTWNTKRKWETGSTNWVYWSDGFWRLGDNAFFYYWTGPADENPPPGNYTADVGVTGTATVAYSIITNSTPATVVVHGIATP